MNRKQTRKIFDLANQGPSGRLKALEKYIKKEQMGEKVSDKIDLLFRMLEDDMHQLEQYIRLDIEATRENDFFKNRVGSP